MKKILYIIMLLPLMGYSQMDGWVQDSTQNYVRTYAYQQQTQVTDTTKAQMSVTYFDGLGRPVQKVAGRATPEGKDIVTHIEYDEYGREARQYLPYATNRHNLKFDTGALVNTENFYDNIKYQNTTNPYTETFFEASPLARVKKTAAPGLPWKGNPDTDNNPDNDNDRTVKYHYSINVEADNVRHFYVAFPTSDTEEPSLSVEGFYQPGELYKNITKDENWTPADGVNKTTEEYTDKQGRLILKRLFNNGTKHDTYYVYDKFNNLTYVIPPLASDQIVYIQERSVFTGVAYPWVSLSYVSQQLSDDYNRLLAAYDNSEILNLDLLDKYGGQGGFSVVPTQNGSVALNLNIITSQPMPLRQGVIADLRDLGTFANKELGRISGSGFEYYFIIRNNAIEVDGYGDVPSQYLNTTLTGENPLDYARNYPWTSFCAGDPDVMNRYNTDINKMDNSEILTTYTPNDYHALGGVAVSLDQDDDFTISFNMSTDTPVELVTGTAFPFEFQRSLPDVVLGTIQGSGYAYEFSIRDNSLYISGSGLVGHINFWNSRTFSQNEAIRSQALVGLCYIYNYDKRNRVVEKKVPGKGWEHMVYDRLDRVAATQDANQRADNQWLFNKYDRYGRVVYTGIFNSALQRTSLQDDYNDPGEIEGLYEERVKIGGGFNKSGTAVQYTDNNYPELADMAELLTVTYYDSYDDLDVAGIVVPIGPSYPILTTGVKSLAIGAKVRVLGTEDWICNMTAYDDKGRPRWNHSKNSYLGSEDIVRTTLDFAGKVTATEKRHLKTGKPELVVYDSFEYDRMGRLLRNRQAQTPITGWDMGPYQHVIANNIYDELGMLESKGVGGKTTASQRLQEVVYKYNVRGWLTDINDVDISLQNTRSLFAFRINYNATDLAESTPLFNGNISETFWKTRNDNKVRSYSYDYDALNRLKSANYHNYGYTINGHTENFTEGPITYDKNGNIKSLKRYGIKANNSIDVIDNLTYTYGSYSNYLNKVNDAAGTDGFTNGTNTGNDYSYDANGNMRRDLNKKIGELGSSQYITYNHLNLPKRVYFGTAGNKYIDFEYDATGVKQAKKVTDAGTVTTTQYDNGFIYEKVNTGANQLKYFNHPEGYAMVPLPSGGTYNPNNFKYIYQYKDHLGNIRLSYTDHNNDGFIAVNASEIVSENNYYAFGMEHKGYNTAVLPIGSDKAQQYKFQEQERQDELGLNWDSFKWRNYDYATGRFFNVDPLAEDYAYQSPYNFSENRIIDGRELEGLERVPINGEAIARNVSYWIDTKVNETSEAISDAWNSTSGWFSTTFSDGNFEGSPERSSEDISVSLRSKNGGGNNPTTTGSADDHWNVDGFFDAAAASGGAKNGNRYSTLKDGVTFLKDINTGIKKSGKATEAIVNEFGNNTSKELDTTITVPNNELYSVPHGNTGYLQKTRNGTKEVTVPNNQTSIDSAKAAAHQQENRKDRLVNESINNIPK